MSNELKGFTDFISGYKDLQQPTPNNGGGDLLAKYWWVIVIGVALIYYFC